MRFMKHHIKNNVMRIFSLGLSLFILFLTTCLTPTASLALQPEQTLVDIKGHWAETVIHKWVHQGLARGYGDGRFGPNDSITRAEFVTLLNRIFNYSQKMDISFADVKAGAWYADEIGKAYKAGIISGDNKGNMNPEAVISRQEAAVILARAFSLQGDCGDTALSYSDGGQIAQWALSSVGMMTKAGYVTGRPGNLFAPKANLSRCEAVKMIDNVMGELINTGGTYKKVVSGNMVVSSNNVTLKDTCITGDLYITEGVNNGSVMLISTAVKGRTIIASGADTLISLTDTLLDKEVVVLNKEGEVNLTAEGITEVNSVILGRNAVLQGKGLVGSGFKRIHVSAPEGTEVVLGGSFDEIMVESPQAIVSLQAGTTDSLVICKEGMGIVLQAEANAVIESLTVSAKADITGGARIKHAIIASDGVCMDEKPQQITMADGGKAISYRLNMGSHAKVTPAPMPTQAITGSNPPPAKKPTASPTPIANPTIVPTPITNPTAIPTAIPTNVPTATPKPTGTPTPYPDKTAPSVPRDLTGTAISSSSVQLNWATSSDNVGVMGYRIYRNGSVVGTSTETYYCDKGLSSGTTYDYSVSAYDAAGNESSRSITVNITTIDDTSATYTLNVVAEHASLGFIPEKEAYSPGEQVKITALPHAGYGFGHWYGDAYGTLEQITITMDSNKTLYAFTPEKKTITLPGGVTMDFVRIPSGSYMMGNISQNPWASQNYPQVAHRVNIAYEFYVQTTETTQEQLIAVMGENSIDANNHTGENVEWMRGNKKPVVNLPWGDTPGLGDDLDAHEFINELNAMGLGEFRLPSEAEWEYFARGPQTNPYRNAPYFFGEAQGILPVDSSSFKLDEYAWWGRSVTPSSGLPETAQLLPNPYGLYDIYGNVYEWCEDDWKNDYNDVPDDGSPYINHAAEYPYKKILRGGWRYYTDAFRFTSYYRESHEIYFSHGSTGIRLVMKVPVDNQPPSMPSSLSAQAVSSAQINLSWVGSTDNDRVSGYKIYRNNKCIGISHTAAFSDLELEPDTAYVYAVQAFDSYGNTSGKTSNVSIKTGILNNARPQIQDQSVSVVEDGEIDINLQAFDGENDPLTYHIVSFPQHGYLYGLYADGTVPVVRYIPAADYDGEDSFTYRVHDSYSYSTTATVSINVTGINKEPLAESFSTSLDAGEQILINLKGKDPDNDYLFYEIVAAPAHGKVVQVGADTVIYTPKEGYSGTDSFTYKANDGRFDSLPADVAITVTPQRQENVLTLNFDGNINDISGQGCEVNALKNESPYTGSLDFVSSSIEGKALSFSKEKGVYLRAEDSDTLSGMNALYISVYAKKSTVDRGGYILQKRDGYALSIFKNSVCFQVRSAAGIVQVNSYSAGIDDTNWHHYEAYYNGHSACLYVDGVQKAKLYTYGAVHTSEYPLYIGFEKPIAFDGEIDQLQIRTKPPTGAGTDTEAPTTPVSLRVTSVTNNQVNLAWDTSVDNTGVIGYRIYRDGAPIATSATANYSNTELTPSTRYVYTVAAYDAAGNESTQSMVLIVTTLE